MTAAMKKIRSFLLAFFALGLLSTQFCGCEQYVLPEITLSPESLEFTASGGVLPLEVEANVKWTLSISSEGASWLSAGATSGNGRLTVGIEAAANTEAQRTATITVSSETIRRRLTVTQAPGQ